MELVISKVSKHFEGVTAVNSVSVICRAGEIIGLIGPNGAGKTTLLNMISSALAVDAGEIRLDRAPIHNIGPRKCAIAGIARTFQNIRLFKNLTVRQNVQVAHTTARAHRADALGSLSIGDLLTELGIASLAERKAGELPYGTQRRVEIARALALAPSFVLLDEPAAGTAEGESEQLVAAINRIRDWMGCGLMIIDHDLHFITNVCERVYVLDMGKIIAEGPPSLLRNDPKVAEVYLGRKAKQ